jgi:hypothetical protein
MNLQKVKKMKEKMSFDPKTMIVEISPPDPEPLLPDQFLTESVEGSAFRPPLIDF